ncbi:galactose-binding like [Fusarium albosuccineum]|uniref:Galactose-binding like n=1 Tax=Fusarium albosuccineum TaxID=1237068 RepID=A0A8H4PC63_9HYPO|nr:galactose-binding like [Fusarium albosuccineum]
MRSQSITLVIAALFGSVTAVPCSYLGWSEDGELFGNADPFDPPQNAWDVVDANDCWVRWQVAGSGQTLNDARVTKTVFEATESQIRSTINNYKNDGGTNIQLWLPMRTRSLQYSYMIPGNLGADHPVVDPQGSLSDSSAVMVSIILPSGKEKLEVVRLTRTGDYERDVNIDRAEDVGITGLRGTISRSDWAYITGSELRVNMRSMLEEQKRAHRGNRAWNRQDFAYVLAEKINGDCVVIDFRNFAEFVIRLPPASFR